MSMFVRLKRETKTWFIHCEPTDKVQRLVDEVADIENKKSTHIRLLKDVDAPLAEDKTLKEQGVAHLQVLFAIWRRDDDGWEEPNVQQPAYEARTSWR